MSNRKISFSRFLSKVGIIASAFFLTTSAFAIDSGAVEPDHIFHDYSTDDVAVTPPTHVIAPEAPTSSITPSAPIAMPSTVIAPSAPPIHVTAPSASTTVNLPTVQTSAQSHPVIDAQDMAQHSQKRIYHARSMTANNPEYKTRFSILHETPSPKRIGGERLYNLSDEIFRIEADGNNIRFLDSPVFKLTGINSATGRYGELQLHEGGALKIHGVSSRFRGKWDVDGTGERLEKVTPTNLVSGDLPATLRTFNMDGSIRTNEDYTLTFKAMAMGPYNGYWTDGESIGIWLWGMSKNKTESGEFTYVGLDLGIITMSSIATGSTGGTDNAAAIAPSAVMPNGNGYGAAAAVGDSAAIATSGVPTAFGGNGFGGNGFGGGGGGFGVIPFGVGGGGGGGSTTVIVKQFCQEYPNDPSCRPHCERFPNDTSCVAPCTAFPDDPTCRPRCDAFPNDPQCQERLCERNPEHRKCKRLCERNPNHRSCKKLCEREPKNEKCNPIERCKRNPKHPDCRPLCERRPNHKKCTTCPDGTMRNPTTGQCGGVDCSVDIDHPDCNTGCPDGQTRDPVTGQCGGVDCSVDIDHPDCNNSCPNGQTRDPATGECTVDKCLIDPTSAECKPTCSGSLTDPETCKPPTGVPAPWGIGAILVAFAGYIFRRRK